MVIKLGENFEKTRHVKNIDKCKKYMLRRQRNVRHYDRVVSNQQKCKSLTLTKFYYLKVHCRIKILEKTLLANFLVLLFLAYPSEHSWQSFPSIYSTFPSIKI